MPRRPPAFSTDVPFRVATQTEAKRAALEELRMADRLLLPMPGPSFVDLVGTLFTLFAFPLGLGDSSGLGSSAQDDVRQARGCLQRALELVPPDGLGEAERRVLARLDDAYGKQLRPVVRAFFERIRASDPSLHDVEPLDEP